VANRAHATVDAAQLEDGSRQITSGSSQDWLVTRVLPSGCATATSESLSVLGPRLQST
jgi:hypothetical protein